MLAELLRRLEAEHGISADKGNNILNMIAKNIKEKFPQFDRMINSALVPKK